MAISDSVYFVIKGSVKCYKINRFDVEIFLCYFSEKDAKDTNSSCMINDFHDFQQSIFYSNIECLTDCEIIGIEIKPLFEIATRDDVLFKNLMREIMIKNKNLRTLIDREVIFDSMAKVAQMMDLDIDRFNSIQKQEIAYSLNIQPETLSRILRKMQKDEVIVYGGDGKIVVKNRDRLIELYRQL